ncbi:hypothetical protein QR680_017688 [Steinernema hermaphroditum]|uniref:Uncharacterized protein n=1 Tax=Steinernema hermaphroditum TaxID=289476 RepID=A0AA39LPR7_9BILA|nr:hypothetical protein QR680_017688 [Steinernema hermaphroditum]
MPTEHHVSDGLAYCAELVLWKPASIYKSFCPISIEYFSLRHPVVQHATSSKKVSVPRKRDGSVVVLSGLEWDLMYLHSIRFSGNAKFYIDIIFDIALQRKTLFYAVNRVIPCMLIDKACASLMRMPPYSDLF